jgi:hypothetical protein
MPGHALPTALIEAACQTACQRRHARRRHARTCTARRHARKTACQDMHCQPRPSETRNAGCLPFPVSAHAVSPRRSTARLTAEASATRAHHSRSPARTHASAHVYASYLLVPADSFIDNVAPRVGRHDRLQDQGGASHERDVFTLTVMDKISKISAVSSTPSKKSVRSGSLRGTNRRYVPKGHVPRCRRPARGCLCAVKRCGSSVGETPTRQLGRSSR